MKRREWLVSAALVASVRPAWARWIVQEPVLDARQFGATGDGVTDDTAALQRAIDAGAHGGQAVTVPAGQYLLDAVRGLQLRDRTDLRIAATASLVARPNAEPSSAILRGVGISGLHITGGTLVGERRGHLDTKGEWGMGIDLRGCTDAVIEGLTARDCWGDGFYVGHTGEARRPGGECRNITLRGCRGLGNRRQGLSIVGCVGGLIENCEFSGTQGTPPECGVDFEPNPGKVVSGIVVRGCTMADNAGWGGVIWGATVTDCSFESNTVQRNGKGGLYVWRGARNAIRGNQITVDAGPAVATDSLATGTTVTDNLCRRNAGRAPSASPIIDVNAAKNVVAANACREN